MFRSATILAAVILSIVLAPIPGATTGQANAGKNHSKHADWYSLSLSTDQLFTMWWHINHSLVAITGAMSEDQAWIAALTEL